MCSRCIYITKANCTMRIISIAYRYFVLLGVETMALWHSGDVCELWQLDCVVFVLVTIVFEVKDVWRACLRRISLARGQMWQKMCSYNTLGLHRWPFASETDLEKWANVLVCSARCRSGAGDSLMEFVLWFWPFNCSVVMVVCMARGGDHCITSTHTHSE